MNTVAPTGSARGAIFPLSPRAVGFRVAAARLDAPPSFGWIAFVLLLFAAYGPSISFAGQLRFVEAVLLVVAALNFSSVVRCLDVWEKRFIGIFFLSALSHVITDQITDADPTGTIKRAGTYILLCALIAILKWLGRNSWARIRWILLGYCISYGTLLVIGYGVSRQYSEVPWRLGLGYAVTLGVCVGIAWFPRLLRPGVALLIALAVFHFLAGARSLAAIVLTVAVLALVSIFRGKARPPLISTFRLFAYVLMGLMFAFSIYKLAEYGTNQKWYPAEMQTRMEQQFSSSYGFIAATRPDTVAALYAVQKRPLMGHGSTNVDPDVWRFYADVSTAALRSSNSYNDLYREQLNQDWSLGTPSHSHLFGAWADAGFAAMLGWLLLIGLSIYVGGRAALWSNALAPITTFVSLSNVWDIIFSPGPHRMDVAIRLLILLFALEIFRLIDAGKARTRIHQRSYLPPRVNERERLGFDTQRR